MVAFKPTRALRLAVFFICLPVFYVVFASQTPAQDKHADQSLKLTHAEKEWIQTHPVVRARVGVAPPLHFFDGKYKGISVDYLDFIADKAGFRVEYVTGIPWPKALELIKKHDTIDLLLTAKITPERQKVLAFTREYLKMPWVIFSRDETGVISGMHDLDDKIVSVEAGFVMHKKLASGYPKIRILETESSIEALKAVATGRADAYIGNLTTSAYIIRQNHFSNVKIAGPTPFENHNQAMAIRSDWAELAVIINKVLDSMIPEEHDDIRNHWLAIRYEYGVHTTDIFKWVGLVILFFIPIIGVTLFWNRKLKREIKQRKKIDDALQESEDKFRKMFDRAPLSYQSLDENGNFIQVNATWLDVLGYDEDEVLGRNFGEFIHPDWKEHFQDNFPRFKAIGEVLGVEFEMLKKDGSTILVSFHGKIGRNPDGSFKQTHCIFHDISGQRRLEQERKRLEQKMTQMQKIESIGNLAGGIAHDFNNILYPIVGMSEMLQEDLPPDSPEHAMAEEILTAGKRGGELVKQILSFSRQHEHKLQPVQVESILKEVLKLCRSTIPANIEIRDIVEPKCGLVLADTTQIHQIMMNLITNAFHSIGEENGIIEIRLAPMEIKKADWSGGDSLPVGEYVRMSVADNGEGMPKSILDKIFEPYFTTKERDKGTGLGLSVVYGIIKEHRGDISVTSEPGKGTTFTVVLPVLSRDVEDRLPRAEASEKTGNERILLVDDEASVVGLERQLLERLGYQVTSRTSSIDALELFRSDPDAFDLVISDMAMPRMTGDRLAREMQALNPAIPIIICTGFSERINREQAAGLGIKGFLMKPVLKSELSGMIRQVLDGN